MGAVIAPPVSPFARGTLARKLLLRVVGLVAAAALLLSLFTTLATRQLLLGQLDQQLNSSFDRQQKFRSGGSGYGGRRPPPGGILVPGQQEGTLGAEFVDGQVPKIGVVAGQTAQVELPDAQYKALIAQLTSVPVNGRATSVSLTLDEGQERYRLISRETSNGVVVIGLPLAQADAFLIALVGTEIILSLLAMVGAFAAARAVVVRSLRPLNRVAATAQQVSQLELDRGEVALAVRVPQEDTDTTSEVGRVGTAFNHMLNNVEDALAARQASETKVRQFVADASHELRNPLAAIRGYAELTRRSRDEMPPDAAYAMTRVESEAERMSKLVEDMLLLARLDTGPAVDLQPTDLSVLMVNAVSDARAAGPDHVWSLALPDEPIEAVGDAYRLHQVVANLLANARTHTPPGTRVESTLSVDGADAVITVSDNGPGIPADLQPQVFERFTRAEASRVRAAGGAQGSSTGLGLAIVSAVVEAHQGTVRADSSPGWTRFTVRLPLARSPYARPIAAEQVPGH